MQLSPSYPLETDRLRLRPFSRGDLDALYAYRSRSDVCRFLSDDPMSKAACAEALQARINQTGWAEEGDRILLAVERKADLAMMGEVMLTLRSVPSRQAELGYILHPHYHGEGYATEAGRAMVGLAFTAGIHRTYARCDARNDASRRVMERLGMIQEAHFREHIFYRGAWAEERVFAVLEQDWRNPDLRPAVAGG